MNTLSAIVQDASEPLTGSARDYDNLLARVGDASFVFLGEATHGTHEFYSARAEITKRLITEKGFNAVAIEGDWPDAFRVDHYVRAVSDDADATEALGGFKRFPQWMWRNADVLDFIGWLRERNDEQSSSHLKCGFYGLDLYSLHASIAAVVGYLDMVDPTAAKRARRRYACFDNFGRDTHQYGIATTLGLAPSCEQQVVTELVELRLKEMSYLKGDGEVAADAFFSAEQNAMVIRNAEEYYRAMVRSDFSSWNLRDTHMMETLIAVAQHLVAVRGSAKVVVWAHNSHVGNARATQMADRGEVNLGQLARQRFGPSNTVLIGLTTSRGSVTAASQWDRPAERKTLRPPLADSYEFIFSDTGISRFWLNFSSETEAAFQLRAPRLQRAVGGIYSPDTELESHYFNTRLPDQFDGILHFDHTRAVEPLERTGVWTVDEVEETYPTGL